MLEGECLSVVFDLPQQALADQMIPTARVFASRSDLLQSAMPYDAVVVGSGPNGLAAAIVLLLNRFHLVWVVFGIFLHLGTGVTMGLMSFGLVMISALIFTIRDSEWSWIETRVSSLFRKVFPKTSPQV